MPDVLRLCGVHESVAAEQHGGHVPAGQGDDDAVHPGDSDGVLREDVLGED